MAVRADRASTEPRSGVRITTAQGQVVIFVDCPEGQQFLEGETACIWASTKSALRLLGELTQALKDTGGLQQ